MREEPPAFLLRRKMLNIMFLLCQWDKWCWVNGTVVKRWSSDSLALPLKSANRASNKRIPVPARNRAQAHATARVGSRTRPRTHAHTSVQASCLAEGCGLVVVDEPLPSSRQCSTGQCIPVAFLILTVQMKDGCNIPI